MKKYIFIIILSFSYVCFFGQPFKVINLPFNEVSEINKYNDSLVKNEIYPEYFGVSVNIYKHVTLNSIRNDNIPEYYIEEKKKRMEERKVKNDFSDKIKFVVYKKDKIIFVKKFPTNIEYLYYEGCDIEKTVIVKELELEKESNLLGVFSTDIITNEYNDTYIEIKDSINNYLTPNKKYIIGDIILEHKAILCKDYFDYDHIYISEPTFFNVELSINKNGEEHKQVIFSLPHEYSLRLLKILLTDLNNDGLDDLILFTSDELCTYSLFYLTNSTNFQSYEYIGFSEECECP